MSHPTTLFALIVASLGLFSGAALAESDPIVISDWVPNPAEATAPADFKKPSNYLQTEDYLLIQQTSPSVPDVGQEFRISVELREPEGGMPLALDAINGHEVNLYILQRRGFFGQIIGLDATRPGVFESSVAVPYSGGHILFVVFQPAGKALVAERLPFWVESIAVNGKDITGAPRNDGPWAEMPTLTKKWNEVARTTEGGTTTFGSSRIVLNSGTTYGTEAIVDVRPADNATATAIPVIATSANYEKFLWGAPLEGDGGFSLQFPSPGTYRIWAEVEEDGARMLVPFKVKVS